VKVNIVLAAANTS